MPHPSNNLSSTPPSRFWLRWLQVACGGTILFGLAMVLFPEMTRSGFSLLMYADAGRIGAFGESPARYIGLAHAVIGGLIVGWAAGMLYASMTLVARRDQVGWNLVATMVAAWFVPDTAYALASGFWQNAALNAVFFGLFAAPLTALRRSMRTLPR